MPLIGSPKKDLDLGLRKSMDLSKLNKLLDDSPRKTEDNPLLSQTRQSVEFLPTPKTFD